jgi:hypothetical protein
MQKDTEFVYMSPFFLKFLKVGIMYNVPLGGKDINEND